PSTFRREHPRCFCRCGIGECPVPPGSKAPSCLAASTWRLTGDPGIAATFHDERDHRLALFWDSEPLGAGALGGRRLSVWIVRLDRRMGRMVLAPDVSA